MTKTKQQQQLEDQQKTGPFSLGKPGALNGCMALDHQEFEGRIMFFNDFVPSDHDGCNKYFMDLFEENDDTNSALPPVALLVVDLAHDSLEEEHVIDTSVFIPAEPSPHLDYQWRHIDFQNLAVLMNQKS
ncbi:hypothetical protein PGTUg99_020074 [Puccinia graminis f. sp. tritici]|uniref:Uncharacterized protein n=1 Tax=Puccinia graminis f. sp. tritici TaxID=56615 RepID=A0A5B0Q0X6_PUCGR|nr:hypothetical protein PGTUg99_020074 [Puccinia graminis f. sp. tritici]